MMMMMMKSSSAADDVVFVLVDVVLECYCFRPASRESRRKNPPETRQASPRRKLPAIEVQRPDVVVVVVVGASRHRERRRRCRLGAGVVLRPQRRRRRRYSRDFEVYY